MTDETPVKPSKKPVLKLKKDHVHAGKLYPAGTKLNDITPVMSSGTLDFLKQRDII